VLLTKVGVDGRLAFDRRGHILHRIEGSGHHRAVRLSHTDEVDLDLLVRRVEPEHELPPGLDAGIALYLHPHVALACARAVLLEPVRRSGLLDDRGLL
jgi:hypothetical protein